MNGMTEVVCVNFGRLKQAEWGEAYKNGILQGIEPVNKCHMVHV